MSFPGAYTQYANNRILAASPSELTLMLYEGAIKFCNIAEVAIEQKNIAKAHTNIIKTEKIVSYLRDTLDMKYPVAQDYERMYLYLERRLVEANMSKDIDILKEVNAHLHSICDTWKEVMRINREKGIK